MFTLTREINDNRKKNFTTIDLGSTYVAIPTSMATV